MNLFDFYIPEWIFVAANLIILVFIMKKLLWKPVLKVLDARQEMVLKAERDMTEAARLREEVEQTRDQLVSEMDARSSELLKDARVRAGREYDRIIAEAENKSALINDAARIKAEQEHERVLVEAQGQISSTILEVAGALMRTAMDAEENNRLIDELLKEKI